MISDIEAPFEYGNTAVWCVFMVSDLVWKVQVVGAPPNFCRLWVSCGRRLVGSLIGGIRETQEMLNFCADHGITCDIEALKIQEINEATHGLSREMCSSALSSTWLPSRFDRGEKGLDADPGREKRNLDIKK
jgi:hypothetical protein